MVVIFHYEPDKVGCVSPMVILSEAFRSTFITLYDSYSTGIQNQNLWDIGDRMSIVETHNRKTFSIIYLTTFSEKLSAVDFNCELSSNLWILFWAIKKLTFRRKTLWYIWSKPPKKHHSAKTFTSARVSVSCVFSDKHVRGSLLNAVVPGLTP